MMQLRQSFHMQHLVIHNYLLVPGIGSAPSYCAILIYVFLFWEILSRKSQLNQNKVRSHYLIVELVVAPGLAAPEVLDHEREEADCVDDEDEDDVLVRVGAVVVVAAPTPQQPHLRQQRGQVGAQLPHDGTEKEC